MTYFLSRLAMSLIKMLFLFSSNLFETPIKNILKETDTEKSRVRYIELHLTNHLVISERLLNFDFSG